jgi:hypothetical protein
MKRVLTIVGAVSLTAIGCADPSTEKSEDLGTVTSALGDAHFIKHSTAATLEGTVLVVTFKEAGLSSGSVETVQVSATGTATYLCINNGGQHPKASNKETVSTELTNSGQFTADQSGNIQGSLSLSPPGPGGFTCPSGQTLTGPTDVRYTNIQLTDLTSGATSSLGNE